MFRDVVQLPFFPAEPFAFGLGDVRGGFLEVGDAFDARGIYALMHRDAEMHRVLVMDVIHRLDRKLRAEIRLKECSSGAAQPAAKTAMAALMASNQGVQRSWTVFFMYSKRNKHQSPQMPISN
jgi:hypothetical protein